MDSRREAASANDPSVVCHVLKRRLHLAPSQIPDALDRDDIMLKRFAIFALLGPGLTYLVIAAIAVTTTLTSNPARGPDMLGQFARIAAGWFSVGHVVIYVVAAIPCGLASFPAEAAGRCGSIAKRVLAAVAALALMCVAPGVLAYIVFPSIVFPIATLLAGGRLRDFRSWIGHAATDDGLTLPCGEAAAMGVGLGDEVRHVGF